MSSPGDQQQQSGASRDRRAHAAAEREARAPLLHIGNVLQVDVEGAPAKLGQQVTVVRASNDETVERRFLGRTGTVCGLLYDAQEQYPADPLVLVRVSGLGEDLFFPEELGL
jgi:hypothetical protein